MVNTGRKKTPEPRVRKITEPEESIVSIKNIDVVPNFKYKTKVLVVDMSPGVNLLKGYHATCPGCNNTKIVFTKSLYTCGEVFEIEHDKDKSEACMNGKYPMKISFETINDTGYLCTAIDPDDNGGNPQFINIYFSNKIIPEDAKEKSNFETDIQIRDLIIVGKIKPMPSNKKITEWFLDIEKYEFEEKQADIDYSLLNKYPGISRNDKFFEENFLIKTKGRILQKKVAALTLLSPYRAIMPNGESLCCIPASIELGDPGQGKTTEKNELLNYCKKTKSGLLYVENATMRGMIAATIKNPTTGQWMIKVGKIPLRHKQLVILDGYGKLSEADYPQMRSIIEEHFFEINKAASIKRHCAVRFIALGNLIRRVSDYFTKHQASFDLGATESDRPHKFSGADRRRFYHVIVIADEDENSNDIDTHLYLNYEKGKDLELQTYWENLRELAWNIKEDSFIWDEGLYEDASEQLNKLKKEYPQFTLDYGILSKGGMKKFLVQLPAVAILHESFTKDYHVQITKEHSRWLMKLYEEELRALGLSIEKEKTEYMHKHAEVIVKNATPQQQAFLALLSKYGSQSAIEKAGHGSRKNIYTTFRTIVKYSMTTFDVDTKKTSSNDFFYSFNDGSGHAELKGNPEFKSWYEMTEFDGTLEPLQKNDGTITQFGKILLRCAKETSKDKNPYQIYLSEKVKEK